MSKASKKAKKAQAQKKRKLELARQAKKTKGATKTKAANAKTKEQRRETWHCPTCNKTVALATKRGHLQSASHARLQSALHAKKLKPESTKAKSTTKATEVQSALLHPTTTEVKATATLDEEVIAAMGGKPTDFLAYNKWTDMAVLVRWSLGCFWVALLDYARSQPEGLNRMSSFVSGYKNRLRDTLKGVYVEFLKMPHPNCGDQHPDWMKLSVGFCLDWWSNKQHWVILPRFPSRTETLPRFLKQMGEMQTVIKKQTVAVKPEEDSDAPLKKVNESCLRLPPCSVGEIEPGKVTQKAECLEDDAVILEIACSQFLSRPIGQPCVDDVLNECFRWAVEVQDPLLRVEGVSLAAGKSTFVRSVKEETASLSLKRQRDDGSYSDAFLKKVNMEEIQTVIKKETADDVKVCCTWTVKRCIAAVEQVAKEWMIVEEGETAALEQEAEQVQVMICRKGGIA